MRTTTKAIGILVIFLCVIGLTVKNCSFSNKSNIEPKTTWSESIATTTEPILSNTPTSTVGATASTEPVIKEWIYPLSEEEINLIALVTMGEAEGETEFGKRLVIDTILNRVDDSHFPDTVTDVIYHPNQFSVMWNGRIDRCYVMPEIVELVKEELLERTNYDCIFFTTGGYSKYGKPMFQECCHYFSSYE